MIKEQVAFQSSRDTLLTGFLCYPERKTTSIIIISHGFREDKKEQKMFWKATNHLCEQGFTVLLLDFTRSEEYKKTPITIKNQVEDIRSSIQFVQKKGFIHIGLLGFCWSGMCSLLSYNKKITTMVLWAPTTKPKIHPSLKSKEIQKELYEKGYIKIRTKSGSFIKLDKELFMEIKKIGQEQIVSKVKCPILIIHGDNDDVIPLDQSKSAQNYFTNESKLEVIEHSDHYFSRKFSKVLSLSTDWFAKYI